MLSRCTFTFARKRPFIARFPETDTIKGVKIYKKIKNCLDRLPEASTPKMWTMTQEEPDDLDGMFGTPEPAKESRFIVPETDAAKVMIDQFIIDLGKEDETFTPELDTHFKRYLILQAIFSDNQIVDEDKVKRGILWTRNQLAIRQVLWPEDAGKPTEQFEHKIRKALAAKGPLSLSRLVDYCHVRRPGSGGMEDFLRAIKSLTNGGEIKVVGRTRKGAAIYALTRSIQ